MHHRCHKHSKRGSVMLETAIIFLAFFALVLAVMDVGQVMFLHQTLSERARAATRWGVGRPFNSATQTAMQNIVLYNDPAAANYTSGSSGLFGLTRDNVTVEQAAGNGDVPARLRVNVRRYGFQFVAPYLAGKWTGREISVTLPSESAN